MIPLSPSLHFSPLRTSLNLPFKLEWRLLLTDRRHHKPVTPSYDLSTFQTLLKMQHSGIVFLLQWYHSTCNYLYVPQGYKTALENIRKTATFAYTCIWEIQGLQLREESEWRQEQPVLGGCGMSGLGVTACPSSSTCSSSSKKSWYLRFLSRVFILLLTCSILSIGTQVHCWLHWLGSMQHDVTEPE